MINSYERLGWKKDKFDGKDFLHAVKPMAALPDEVDLSHLLKTAGIRDQGNEGSCVGHGVGAAVTMVAVSLGLFSEWFSPRDIYNGAKYVGGYLTEEGAYPKDAWVWLTKKGCLLEHFWPYIAGKDSSKAPSSKFDIERAKFPILRYIRVTDGINGIYSALASGHPVSLGCPWPAAWMDAPNGKLSAITANSEIAGGHETVLTGYSKAKKIVRDGNSWSPEWGDEGFCNIPSSSFEVFKKIEGYDAHYCEVEWVSAPVAIKELIRLQSSTDGGASWVDLFQKSL